MCFRNNGRLAEGFSSSFHVDRSSIKSKTRARGPPTITTLARRGRSVVAAAAAAVELTTKRGPRGCKRLAHELSEVPHSFSGDSSEKYITILYCTIVVVIKPFVVSIIVVLPGSPRPGHPIAVHVRGATGFRDDSVIVLCIHVVVVIIITSRSFALRSCPSWLSSRHGCRTRPPPILQPTSTVTTAPNFRNGYSIHGGQRTNTDVWPCKKKIIVGR